MNRGLDYFAFDVHRDKGMKLFLIEFGAEGMGILALILQSIYGEEGYYMHWDGESEMVIAAEGKCSAERVREIIERCVGRGIFDRGMYEKYGILTSEAIQQRYCEACRRRKNVELIKEYLLFDATDGGERKNVTVTGAECIHSDDTLHTSCIHADDNLKQSKVKKSKVKESKVNKEQKESGVVVCSSGIYKEVFGRQDSTAEQQLEGYLDVMERELVVHILELAKIDAKPWRWVTKVLDTHYAQKTRTVEQFKRRCDEYSARSRPPVGGKFNDYEQHEDRYDIAAIERRAMEKRQSLAVTTNT